MADDDLPRTRSCGTMPVHERLLRTDSSYLHARARSETNAWEVEAAGGAVARRGITVIPTVVHVVYRTAAQNISDAQIQSQIDVLNRDFRMTNADVRSLPAVFAPLAADARIEFELARRDPSGRATSGITRTRTSAASFSDDDRVKSSRTAGVNAWPSDRYLNLWVCQLGGGLLGYAQFPGGAAATDGVVIRQSAFGTTGTAAAPFNLGRTATHEIGHWLNLRHVWGDDGTGCSGDDFVADTPNCAGSNGGIPAFPHVTCRNGPNGDLFMNYMDYTDDAGMFMFTAGQVARMQASLDADRPTIGYQKAGPKFKIADDPITLKFRDDIPKLQILDQGIPKLPAADIPRIPIRRPIPEILINPVGPVAGRAATPFVLSTPHHSQAWSRSFPGAFQQQLAQLAEQIGQYEQVLGQYQQAHAAGQLAPADVEAFGQLSAAYGQLVEEYQRLAAGG
ncbi:zinc metalloprotease [Conexibacter sp. JD483]|uniref:zinc metalloprotease n=1 Tax=unclassified Conexibacter TaxID=2627773 RepID=UPI00271A41DD|nr:MULTISPECIES: zinc metalloprotease [unclassified Conexibacter]MDO8184751.1 zinc metalloprotease [Conexibacter sp. CPCC 205706]MDO8196526.1 zinc metalloprotease [Conexibacter sp. CPCC 205762]MDR9369012.1 zinc metalloprotease [Conexibacter sp. JD483]